MIKTILSIYPDCTPFQPIDQLYILYIPFTATTPFGDPSWGPNLDEFRKRFDPDKTWGEGPKRLKNLYFTYLVELRALAKAAPYLQQVSGVTGFAHIKYLAQ